MSNLLTKEEIDEVWAGEFSYNKRKLKLIEAQDAKTYAACNQEWQGKINEIIGHELLENRYKLIAIGWHGEDNVSEMLHKLLKKLLETI